MSKPPELSAESLAVLRRIEEARGAYLQRTHTDLLWVDIGRGIKWGEATTSAIKNAKRAIRLEEIRQLAQILSVAPAWLAVGEGDMRPAHHDQTRMSGVTVQLYAGARQ